MLQATSPRFPIDALTKDGTGIPWALVARPLFGLELHDSCGASEGETSADEIARCDGCGGYISGICRMNTQYWECSLCEKRCKLPDRYQEVVRKATLDELQKFPELSEGTCNVSVDTNAEAMKVMPVAYIFIVDGTVDKGLWEIYTDAIAEALKVTKGNTMFGVVVYTNQTIFLDLRGKGAFRILPVEMSEGLAPKAFAPDQWLRMTASDEVIESCRRTLSWFRTGLFANSQRKAGTLLNALRSSLEMLESAEFIAARISIFTSGTAVDASSMNGERRPEGFANHFATKVKQSIANSTDALVSELAQRAFTIGAMVDAYLPAKPTEDAAKVLALVKGTGGQACIYEEVGENLRHQIVWALKNPCAVHGITRVRTSPQMLVHQVYGFTVVPHVEIRDVYETADQGMNSTLILDLEYAASEGFQAVSSKPVVQFAYRCVLIEPGMLPRRLLRICTTGFRASSSRNIIRMDAQADVIAMVLFRKALEISDMSTTEDARSRVKQWVSNLLARCARPSDLHGSLQIDPAFSNLASVRRLPQYLHGLCRSRVLRGISDTTIDDVMLRFRWERMSAEQLSVAMFPQVISFKNHGQLGNSNLRPSFADVLECDDPVFLLNAMWIIVIYFKSTAAKRSISYPPPANSIVTTLQNEITRNCTSVPQIVMCREGTPGEVLFRSLLITDAAQNEAGESFEKFLNEVTENAKLLLPNK